MRCYEVTDEQWKIIEPHLGISPNDWVDRRLITENCLREFYRF